MKELLEQYLPVFKTLSTKEQNQMISDSRLTFVKKDELIYQTDSSCLGIMVVISGSVGSFMTSNNGRILNIFVLNAYDTCLLSAHCAFKDLNFEVNFQSFEDSEILIIEGESFKQLVQTNIQLSNYLNNLLQDKVNSLLQTLEKITFLSIEERLQSFLLDYANEHHTNIIEITHEKIAQQIGTSREVISRNLKKLEKENQIRLFRGGVELNFLKNEDSECDMKNRN